MHEPEKVPTGTLDDYLAALSRSALEPGLNWNVLEAKWPGIVEAFHGFSVRDVAALTPADIDDLMNDHRVIRNRRKLEAIVHNAGEMLCIAPDAAGFRAYLRSHGSFEATVADMRRRFKFIGEMGAYHFLFVVGEHVPAHEDWLRAHPESGARH
jgi:3-methyladenine DNA glycosylase Tag